jgi:hypothetical protein
VASGFVGGPTPATAPLELRAKKNANPVTYHTREDDAIKNALSPQNPYLQQHLLALKAAKTEKPIIVIIGASPSLPLDGAWRMGNRENGGINRLASSRSGPFRNMFITRVA